MLANLSASGSETEKCYLNQKQRTFAFTEKFVSYINVSDSVHFKSHTFHSVKSAQHANGVVASPPHQLVILIMPSITVNTLVSAVAVDL